MNRKSNSDDFNDKSLDIKTKPFQRWIQKNNLASQTPVIIEESFRNLENPIAYIHDQEISKLQQKTRRMEENMRYEKQSISEMSKLNYKKVISRDKVQYQFGNAAIQRNIFAPSQYHDYQKRSAKKADDNQKILQKREQLKKQFIHGNTRSQYGQKLHQKGLTMDFIRDLDTKQFEKKYKSYEFYNVFIEDPEEGEKYPIGQTDISDNYDMDQLFNKLKFNLFDNDAQYSAKSAQYLFKADQELDFWRRNIDVPQTNNNTQQIQIMKRCQNFNVREPSYLHLLDFAAGKLDGQILAYYFKLKARHQTQMKLNENDQNLQQEYNKKKQQLQSLKDRKRNDKIHRIDVRPATNQTQTNDKLQQQSFDSYFEESAKDLTIKISQLNKIRDTLMASKQQQSTRKTMLINIGHEIKNLLFRLLTLTLKGETFINYDEIIQMEDQGMAQKKMLEVIYHEFHKIKIPEVDGIAKTKILNIYLEEREKNEKIFELLGRTHVKQKHQAKNKRKK